MNSLMLVLAMAALALGMYVFGRMRPDKVVEPKPFGLEAFESHGLGRANGDVMKAVVATVTFLGHPFTVVEEAKEEMSSADNQSAKSLARVQKNLEQIRGLEAANAGLRDQAKWSDARASAMEALVAQVNSVIGDNN